MTLAARLAAVRASMAAACAAAKRVESEVTLVAVSKTQPVEVVRQALQLGLSVFGENRVQELAGKAAALRQERPAWHMIGSVQTNKVRDLLAIEGLALVHSLDRRKLADALQERLTSPEVEVARLACLIEVNASGDPSKHGAAPGDALDLLRHVQTSCPALSVHGLMAMGPLVGDPRPTFARVVRLRDDLRQATGLPLSTLSLGMSGDFEAAIAAGSTIVRIGSRLFGPRAA